VVSALNIEAAQLELPAAELHAGAGLEMAAQARQSADRSGAAAEPQGGGGGEPEEVGGTAELQGELKMLPAGWLTPTTMLLRPRLSRSSSWMPARVSNWLKRWKRLGPATLPP